MKEHTYLGDGVYCSIGEFLGEIVIFTTDGINITNRIYLGPDEIKELSDFLTKYTIFINTFKK